MKFQNNVFMMHKDKWEKSHIRMTWKKYPWKLKIRLFLEIRRFKQNELNGTQLSWSQIPSSQILTRCIIYTVCVSVLLISSYQMVPTCMYYPQPHPCFNWPWRASGPGHRWACTSIARLAILYAPNIVRDHVYFSLLARQVSWIMPPPHACYQGPETGIIRGSQLSNTHFYDSFRRPCLGVWEKWFEFWTCLICILWQVSLDESWQCLLESRIRIRVFQMF